MVPASSASSASLSSRSMVSLQRSVGLDPTRSRLVHERHPTQQVMDAGGCADHVMQDGVVDLSTQCDRRHGPALVGSEACDDLVDDQIHGPGRDPSPSSCGRAPASPRRRRVCPDRRRAGPANAWISASVSRRSWAPMRLIASAAGSSASGSDGRVRAASTSRPFVGSCSTRSWTVAMAALSTRWCRSSRIRQTSVGEWRATPSSTRSTDGAPDPSGPARPSAVPQVSHEGGGVAVPRSTGQVPVQTGRIFSVVADGLGQRRRLAVSGRRLDERHRRGSIVRRGRR